MWMLFTVQLHRRHLPPGQMPFANIIFYLTCIKGNSEATELLSAGRQPSYKHNKCHCSNPGRWLKWNNIKASIKWPEIKYHASPEDHSDQRRSVQTQTHSSGVKGLDLWCRKPNNLAPYLWLHRDWAYPKKTGGLIWYFQKTKSF